MVPYHAKISSTDNTFSGSLRKGNAPPDDKQGEFPQLPAEGKDETNVKGNELHKDNVENATVEESGDNQGNQTTDIVTEGKDRDEEPNTMEKQVLDCTTEEIVKDNSQNDSEKEKDGDDSIKLGEGTTKRNAGNDLGKETKEDLVSVEYLDCMREENVYGKLERGVIDGRPNYEDERDLFEDSLEYEQDDDDEGTPGTRCPALSSKDRVRSLVEAYRSDATARERKNKETHSSHRSDRISVSGDGPTSRSLLKNESTKKCSDSTKPNGGEKKEKEKSKEDSKKPSRGEKMKKEKSGGDSVKAKKKNGEGSKKPSRGEKKKKGEDGMN
ncbi:uncharacterized protein [Macrobrachium rosenbergii]|uniref:uncharacterized protein n=1 Tax=Macrobrachium rosenbergii TaxID=79674 RepID=UPI0034D62ED1